MESLLENADADSDKLEEEKNNIRAIVEKLPYTNLSLEGWGGDKLEDLYFCMPDLPVLRYQRLRYRTWRTALPLLGFLYVFRLYDDGSRK